MRSTRSEGCSGLFEVKVAAVIKVLIHRGCVDILKIPMLLACKDWQGEKVSFWTGQCMRYRGKKSCCGLVQGPCEGGWKDIVNSSRLFPREGCCTREACTVLN